VSSPARSRIVVEQQQPGRRRFRHGVVAGARGLLLGAAAGAWAGLIVGGVGGRLAMFVLRLTSPDYVRSVTSDDGFEIGVISTDTLFLLALTVIGGALAGSAYAVARQVLPLATRPWVWAFVGGTVGGSAILHGDGVDFNLLEPAPLAVAMFIIIPAGGAAVMAILAERWDRWWFTQRRRTVLLAAPLALLIPVFVLPLVAAAAVVVVAAVSQIGWIRTVTRLVGPPFGRVLIGIVGALASWALVNDVTEIL
jgi:hypothetical protein